MRLKWHWTQIQKISFPKTESGTFQYYGTINQRGNCNGDQLKVINEIKGKH